MTAALTAALVFAQAPSWLFAEALPATASAVPVIDQEQPTAEQAVVLDIVNGGQQLAQTLTVGISGRLTGFAAPIFCPDDATLQFSAFHNAVTGQPGGNAINGIGIAGSAVKGTPD